LRAKIRASAAARYASASASSSGANGRPTRALMSSGVAWATDGLLEVCADETCGVSRWDARVSFNNPSGTVCCYRLRTVFRPTNSPARGFRFSPKEGPRTHHFPRGAREHYFVLVALMTSQNGYVNNFIVAYTRHQEASELTSLTNASGSGTRTPTSASKRNSVRLYW